MNTKLLNYFICLLLSLQVFSQNIIPVRTSNNKSYEYKDSITGKIISQYNYDQANPFIDGMARVGRNGFYGYIDLKGEEVVPCKYINARDFSGGLASVSIGIIETNGSFNFPKDEKFGVIDKKGNIIADFQFEEIGPYKYKIARSKDLLTHKWGWIDSYGKWKILPKYSSAQDFDEMGMALVSKEQMTNKEECHSDLFGFINIYNEFLIPPIYQYLYEFEDNLAIATNCQNKSGFINRKGEVIISLNYDRVEPFNEGLALVANYNKIGKMNFGFINLNGNEKIPLNFQYAHSFSGVMAFVKKDGRFGWIDKNGNFLIKNYYDIAEDFTIPENLDEKTLNVDFNNTKVKKKYDFAIVSKNGFWGAINLSGKEIVPVIYDSIAKGKDGFVVLKGIEKININNEGKKTSNSIKVTPHEQYYKFDLPFSLNFIHDKFDKYIDFRDKQLKNIGNKYGLVNNNGTKFCEIVYDSINCLFVNYHAAYVFIAYRSNKIDFIYEDLHNKDKAITFSTNYSEAKNKEIYSLQKPNFIRVKKDKKFGVINASNGFKEIMKPEFDDIGIFPGHYNHFKNGKILIPFEKNKKWGIYDASESKMFLPAQFDAVSGFNNRDFINLCFVKMKNKWALMNENGKLLTDYLFDDVLCFAHGLAGVKKDDKWGYINYSGHIFTPTIFDEVNIHDEYKAYVKLNKMIIVLEEFGEWVY